MSWLWFAVKNVGRYRRRAAVTALIAAVGTAALLAFGGYGQYTYAALAEASARDSGHLVLAQRAFFDGEEDVPMQHGLPAPEAVRAALEADPRVRAALPRLPFSGLLSNGDKSAVFVGTGVDPGGEMRERGPFLSVTAGGTLSPAPAAGDLPEIMVGAALARSLRAGPGSSLTLLATTTEGSLNAQDVRVKGVYTTGVAEMDRRAVMVHLATAQRLLLTDRVGSFSVYLQRLADVEPARAALSARFPDLALHTWLDEAVYYRSVRALYDRLFGVLGIIIVTLVLFAVANTLGMTVVERTREIGTLRALGAVPGLLTRGFVVEGVVVALCGAALGSALAGLLALAIDAAGVQMPPPPGRSVGYPLHLQLTPGLFATAALAVLGASALAAWSASRKAAARDIVEALGHV